MFSYIFRISSIMRWAISRTTPWKYGFVSTSGGGEFRSSILRFTPAAATHFSLGLWALYQRRHFRYTAIEITQLVFGLSIPLLIASHLGIMRLGGLLYGRDPPFYSGSVVRLLGQPPLHDRRPVFASHCRLDPCLHRPLFLAPAKNRFSSGPPRSCWR